MPLKSITMQHHILIKKARSIIWPSLLLLGLTLSPLSRSHGQEAPNRGGLPISLSVFTHSVSLPNLRSLFREPNWGLRIGTEWAYGKKTTSHWVQTFHLGFYHHEGFQQGLFVGTDCGYRQHFGRWYADLTLGANYLYLKTALPRYEPTENGFQPASPRLHKLMPALGLNLAYRTSPIATVFFRYETFGEIPFNYQGVPVLPHQALHLGARIRPF